MNTVRGFFLLAIVGASVLVAATSPFAIRAAVAQSEELEVSLSAGEYAFHVSGAVELIVTFRNGLNEPLRVLNVTWGPDVLVRDAAGNLYVQGPGGVSGGSDSWSQVLQPGEVITDSWPLSHIQRADANGVPLLEADSGPMEPGQYTIEVRTVQYEPGDEPLPEQPERLAYGTPVSNPITITAVDDTEPLPPPTARLNKAGKLASVFRHRRVEMVRAEALAPFAVKAVAKKSSLVLRRGSRRVELPLGRVRPVRGAAGPPLPAVASAVGEWHYVPLRYVATKLGLEVRYDARRRLYDLRPGT